MHDKVIGPRVSGDHRTLGSKLTLLLHFTIQNYAIKETEQIYEQS